MKKLNAMLFMALAAVFSFTSCSDDDDTAYGITGVTVTTAEGASYQGVINQATLAINVTVPMTTQAAELEACTILASATMGTTVTINGEALDGATFDLNDAIVLTATNGTESKAYTLTAIISDVADDLAAGKLISADVRGGGIPAGTYAYSVAQYDGKFYAFTNSFDAADSIGHYDVYTSTNGIRWTKDEAAGIIGGMGATPVVFNDELAVYGGVRIFGNDEDGNPAETQISWGMTNITAKGLRHYATTGNGWTDKYIAGDAQDQENRFNALVALGYMGGIDPLLYSFNNELYMLSGHICTYGSFQAPNRNLYKKAGDTFEPVEVADGLRSHNTVFVLNGELFYLGGTGGFFSESQLKKDVYKSTDGSTFTLAADSTAIGAIAGATVVTNDEGNTAYLFGGLQYDETGAQVMNSTIYKSTDGITWEAIEGINPEYKGAYKPYVMVENNVAWVFGGYNSIDGYYAPYSTTMNNMDVSFAAWAFAL